MTSSELGEDFHSQFPLPWAGEENLKQEKTNPPLPSFVKGGSLKNHFLSPLS